MKKIKLSQGKFALVDDEDFEKFNKWRWYVYCRGGNGYALRSAYNPATQKWRSILMHRAIMISPEGMDVDHIDGNGLNNQKYNLRVCSRKENMRNMKKHKDGKSKYKGVTYYGHDNGKNKWVSQIYVDGKNKNLGRFGSQLEAAKIYNEAAIKHYGEFAKLNIL